jgi:uncharacterized protein YfiM (DUF2279 family)
VTSVKLALALAALVAVSLEAGPARASDPDPDPWLGPDKSKHFAASALAAGAGYALGAAVSSDRGRALVLGAAVGTAAGVGKETLDLMGLGDPSWRDLAWDGLGVVFGLAVAWTVDLVVRGVGPERPAIGVAPSALRVAF